MKYDIAVTAVADSHDEDGLEKAIYAALYALNAVDDIDMDDVYVTMDEKMGETE